MILYHGSYLEIQKPDLRYENQTCRYAYARRRLLTNICIMKGVNRFDGQSYFAAKKIYSDY